MRYISLLTILATTLLLSSCGERSGTQLANFHFSIDTSSITQYSTSDNRPTDPLFVSGKGNLTFFGVVVRKVGDSSVDSAGNPVGEIIPSASKMLTSFTDEQQLINLLTSGQATVSTQIPVGDKLAITTYLVYVDEDNTQTEGPRALTTVFSVSAPILVTSGSTDINVSVNTSNHLDNNVSFVDWYGAFADGAGTPITGQNIYARHCKIGFEFSQEMFGNSPDPREKNIFRTNQNGWINSLLINGVDFQVRVGSTIVKPCGNALSKNFPTTPKVLFTGFKGSTLYTDPGAFYTALPAGAQAVIFPGAASAAEITTEASDPDKDGLTTTKEIGDSFSNPFEPNWSFPSKFSGQISHASGPFLSGSSTIFDFDLPGGEDCTTATETHNPANGANPLTYTPTFTNENSVSDPTRHCKLDYATPVFGATPAVGFYDYVIEIGHSYTPPTLHDGTTVPIKHFLNLTVAEGVAEKAEILASPVTTIFRRNWDTDVTTQLNPASITPQLGAEDSEFFITVQDAGLTRGGLFFFARDVACTPAQIEVGIRPDLGHSRPGESMLFFRNKENLGRTTYLCHQKAINSSAQKLLETLTFVPDTSVTYAEVKDQRVVAAPGVPYTPSHIYDSVNARHIICSNENLVPKIRVQVEGTTEVDITMTAPLDNANVNGKPFAFINSAGKPTCAFYDETNKNQIYLATIEAGNTITHDSIALVDVSLTAGANYAYRNGAFFYLAQDSTGAIAGRVVDLATSSTTYTYTIPNTLTTQTNLQSVKPIITSAGEYVVVAYEGPNVDIKRYNGTSFVSVDSYAPTTPVELYAQAGNSGEVYILTTHGPGAKIYKMPSALTAGSLVVDDSTMPLSSGYETGINKSRFVFTNGSEAKYLDESSGTIEDLMRQYNFNSIPQTNEAISFLFDFIYYYFFDSASNTATITKMVTK